MKATANAGSNIAFVKYWGVGEDKRGIRQPLNPSVSMTLSGARTTTTVEFRPDLKEDVCSLNKSTAPPEAQERIRRVLERIRELAGFPTFARVASVNCLPTSAGVASSASGFSALALAAAHAAGLPSEPKEVVTLAILGSGSACRSLPGGYVLWSPLGSGRRESRVEQVASEDHWTLVDLVAIASRKEKAFSSAQGHLTAGTSPFLQARLTSLKSRIPQVIKAIRERNLASLGKTIEEDALSMHAVMMTSRPALLYWEPATVSLLKKVQTLRDREGLPCYFTIDAGPNVHVITEPEASEPVARELKKVKGVSEVLCCPTGPGAFLTEDHLF